MLETAPISRKQSIDFALQIALAKDRELRPHDVATWTEGCAAALERVRLPKPPAGWLVPGALRVSR